MGPENQKRFTLSMVRCADNWRTVMGEPEINHRFNTLLRQPWTIEQVEAGVEHLILHHEGTRLPNIATMLKHIVMANLSYRSKNVGRILCEVCGTYGWLWWAREYPYPYNMCVPCTCQNADPDIKNFRWYISEKGADISEFQRYDGKMVFESTEDFHRRTREKAMESEHLKIMPNLTYLLKTIDYSEPGGEEEVPF